MFAIVSRDLTRQFFPIAAGVLASVGLLVLLVVEQFTQGHLMVVALRTYTALGLAPLAWLLVNRLMLRDGDGSGAAAFYERLPVSRAGVFVLRSLVVAFLVGGLFAVGVGVLVTGAAAIQRPLPADQVDYFIARSVGFLSAVYAWLLLGVALGRHRHLANGLLIGGLVIALRIGWTPGGPFAYPGESFRRPELATALPQSLGLAGAVIVAAIALQRSRWGRRWERAASARDGVRVGLVLGASILLAARFAERPFALDGPVVVAAVDEARVRVRAGAGAQELADLLAADLAGLAEAQGIAPPPLTVDLDRSLRAGHVDRAEGVGAALLLRAAPPASARLRARVLREALDRSTDGRLRSGSWALILEGYPRFRVGSDPSLASQDELRVAWSLHVLERIGCAPLDAVARWAEVRRELGEPLAATLAGWLLTQLAADQGEEAVHELARRAIGSRTGWGGGFDASGQALAGFLRAGPRPSLASASEAVRERQREPLAELVAASSAEVSVELRSEGVLALRGGDGVSLLHAPSHTPHPPARFDRELIVAGGRADTLPYPSGATIAWAVARYAPALGCDLLVRPWTRERAP